MSVHTVVQDPVRAVEPIAPESASDDRSTHLHRQFIGYLGFFLPILLWVISGLRQNPPLPHWEPLGSVSAYYYSGAVVVFAGILAALGIYLFTYRGYGNEHGRRDLIAAWIAGAAAILVAFFPTKPPFQSLEPFWWADIMGKIHLSAAGILFCAFSFFCLFQFPKTSPEESPSSGKRWRNRIYRVCGGGILACISWIVISSLGDAPIFWPEVLALELFALSWLTKGRADRTVVAVGKRTMYYGRNPEKLAGRMAGAIRG